MRGADEVDEPQRGGYIVCCATPSVFCPKRACLGIEVPIKVGLTSEESIDLV